MRALIASTIGAACLAALVTPSAVSAVPSASPVTSDGTARAAIAAQDAAAPRADQPGGEVRSLPLEPLRSGERATEPDGRPPDALGLPATDTEPFSLVGVVWTDASAELDGRVQVRTRTLDSGDWSPWHQLDTHQEHAPEPGSDEAEAPGVRGGTAPLWVGPSDAVEVRVEPAEQRRSGGGTELELPGGLSLELVDPGPEPGPDAAAAPRADDGANGAHDTAGATNDTAGANGAAGSNGANGAAGAADGSADPARPAVLPELTVPETVAAADSRAAQSDHVGPRPAITTRSGWGADEGLREPGFVHTDTVRTVFVHHTAGGNNYACKDAPSVLRSIYQYHVESQGWRDIGYNFFVDRCGTIYEGRAGGVDQPVLGAHTYGHNHNSTGVAVLGTYSETKPSQRAMTAVAQLSAWKLGLYGRDPQASGRRVSGGGTYPAGTEVQMENISGHRDGFATDCPGGQLYQRLPDIRAEAARLQGR